MSKITRDTQLFIAETRTELSKLPRACIFYLSIANILRIYCQVKTIGKGPLFTVLLTPLFLVN
jgi:hypothetical protein